MSACVMHSSMQAWHMATQASRAAVMLSMSMPIGRIIMRIMVLLMSAQFMHMVMQVAIPSPAMESAQIVQAISHAEHASIAACIIDMSIGIMGIEASDMPLDIDIIMSLVMVFMTKYYVDSSSRP